VAATGVQQSRTPASTPAGGGGTHVAEGSCPAGHAAVAQAARLPPPWHDLSRARRAHTGQTGAKRANDGQNDEGP
jgi:hypothetical protein